MNKQIFVECVIAELEEVYSNNKRELNNFYTDNEYNFDEIYQDWCKWCDHNPLYGISGDTLIKENFYDILSKIVLGRAWPKYSETVATKFIENFTEKSKTKFKLVVNKNYL